MSSYNGKPSCHQCSLDAEFKVDGVLACQFHVGSALKVLLSIRDDALVTVVDSVTKR